MNDNNNDDTSDREECVTVGHEEAGAPRRQHRERGPAGVHDAGMQRHGSRSSSSGMDRGAAGSSFFFQGEEEARRRRREVQYAVVGGGGEATTTMMMTR